MAITTTLIFLGNFQFQQSRNLFYYKHKPAPEPGTLRVVKSSRQIICNHINCNFKRFKVQNCIKPIKKYKSGLTLTCFQYYLMFFRPPFIMAGLILLYYIVEQYCYKFEAILLQVFQTFLKGLQTFISFMD